mgnify:CR=1 FL=1
MSFERKLRLIVGGFEGVYEFSRNFRNEGMDRTHNPEFTCMEIYVAYKDYLWMMNFTEEMIETAALAINGTTKAVIGENEIDFKRPFRRVRMADAIKEYTGYDIEKMSEEELYEAEGTFTGSEFVKQTTGVDNVCERSAMCAGGKKILVHKTAHEGVTVAVAVEKWSVDFE